MSESVRNQQPPRWQLPVSLVLSVAIGSVVPPKATLSPSTLSLVGAPSAYMLAWGALPYVILWASAHMRAADHGAFVLSLSTSSIMACVSTLLFAGHAPTAKDQQFLIAMLPALLLLPAALIRAVFDRLTLGRRSQDMAETCRFETSETVRRYAIVGGTALAIAILRVTMAR
ncbi:MAG: hypothetical protein KDB73_09690 [Planctomycetes bacterium]|nr:hypothetical protein [Planctomycetota bacterium]